MYLEIEAIAIPSVKETVMSSLQVDFLQDDTLIMQTMATIQARGLTSHQNDFQISPDLQVQDNKQSP